MGRVTKSKQQRNHLSHSLTVQMRKQRSDSGSHTDPEVDVKEGRKDTVSQSLNRKLDYVCVTGVQTPKMNIQAFSVCTRAGTSKELHLKLGSPRAPETATLRGTLPTALRKAAWPQGPEHVAETSAAPPLHSQGHPELQLAMSSHATLKGDQR